MLRRFYQVCSLVMALTALAAGSVMCAKTIVVQVSDEFDLKDVKTTTVSGRTCIALRPVAEAMGAKVTWNKKSGVLTVSGKAGTAILQIGSTSATINGTRVYFPIAPFIYGGRFFAPLWFYNYYFNQGLIWDPFRQAYRWTWILPPTPYPAPPVIYGPGSGTTATRPTTRTGEARRIVAEVIRVEPSRTNPTITLSLDSRFVTYAIAREALILRGRVGGRATEVPLAEVRPGDRVTVQLNENGVATSVRAQYQEIRGTVQSIAEDRIVLDTGRTLRVSRLTRVILPGNTRGRIDDIAEGDVVIASVSPISGEVSLIAVQEGRQRTEEPTNLFLNTYGPLNIGDTVRVTFRASAGGKALLTIPGLLSDAPMAETSPGTYEAMYTVKTGDILPAEPVSVRFIRPDGAQYQTQSRRPLTIATDSAYLPRIISPRTGAIISSPIVVTGLARPGSRVQVTVEFRRDFAGAMPVIGLSDIQNIRADADGVWKTRPLAATAPWHEYVNALPEGFDILDPLYEIEEYPTFYDISAAEIGPDGTALSAFSVEVEKGRGTEVGL